MQLGDNRLLVQLASTGCKTVVPTPGIPSNPIALAGIDLSKGAGPPTEVLCLMNLVVEEELQKDDEYEAFFFKKFLIKLFKYFKKFWKTFVMSVINMAMLLAWKSHDQAMKNVALERYISN